MNMAQKTITARWVGPDLQYEGTDTKGNILKMGGDGVSPSELVLLGLAGCMGMDIIAVLKKKRLAVASVDVTVTGHQPDDYPKPYQVVEVHFKVTGDNIPSAAVERAISLSYDKYCIVGQTLRNPVEVKPSFEVVSS